MFYDTWQAVVLTTLLASSTTAVLLVLATPIAWWLAQNNTSSSCDTGSSLKNTSCQSRQSIWKNIVMACVSLPLVLPPTVLGFYLLVALGPDGPLGIFTESLGLGTLTFTFSGLLIGSIIYSLPFAVQPLQHAFINIGRHPLEIAATLGARPYDVFLTVILPLARPGFITAAILSFAHTVGEFGVILMVGGNIPGQTQVLSTLIYGHVEALDYSQAHVLAAGLLLFSFCVLLALGRFNHTVRLTS